MADFTPNNVLTKPLDMSFSKILAHLRKHYKNGDVSHGITHFIRVAKHCLRDDMSNPNITIPSALLHDCYHVEKSSPLRRYASKISAAHALIILDELHYDHRLYDDIFHCIEAHSFSANIPIRTAEAQVVQDADRLDALGYIGIFRCFYTGGRMNREICHETEPIITTTASRQLDDNLYSLDHFYVKLLFLVDDIKTIAFKDLALQRTMIMANFIDNWEDMKPLCQIISDGGKYGHSIETIKANLQACYCNNVSMAQELIAAIE